MATVATRTPEERMEERDAVLLKRYEERAAKGHDYLETYEALTVDAEEISPEEVNLERHSRETSSLSVIQPHGVFLALEHSTGKVLCCSDNSEQLLSSKPQELIDHSFSSFFVESSTISRAIGADNAHLSNPLALTVKKSGRVVNVIVERRPWCTTVDVEEADEGLEKGGTWAAHSRVRLSVDALRAAETASLDDLATLAANHIQAFTHHDRVMVYKFYEDFHGEVIGEAAREGLETTYKGLHFPATDIPQRSRDLFESSKSRLVKDFEAPPVPIVWSNSVQDDAILNSNMTLRAVHPCHVEYMRKLSVRAALVLSLSIEQRLWGLVVCHTYDRPHFLPYQHRNALEFMIQVLGGRIAGLEAAHQARARAGALQYQARVFNEMLLAGTLGLTSAPPAATLMLKSLLTNASKNPMTELLAVSGGGGAVLFGSEVSTVGSVPPESVVRQIAAWGTEKGKPRWTDKLSDELPGLEAHASVAAGALVVPLPGGCLLWVKPETMRTVDWAGDPDRVVQVAANKRTLLPRKSFQKFAKTVNNTSLGWTLAEREAAESLATFVRDVLIRAQPDRMVEMNRQAQVVRAECSAVAAELLAVMEASSMPAFETTIDGKVTFWSPKMASITGYSEEEARGVAVLELASYDNQAVWQQALDKAMRVEGPNAIEVELRGKAGQLVQLWLSCSPRKDAANMPVGVFFVGVDVTQARAFLTRCSRLESGEPGGERVEEREARTAFAVDLDGLITEWSDSMASLTKLTRGEVLGQALLGQVFGKLLSYTEKSHGVALEAIVNSAILGKDPPFFEFSLFSEHAGIVDLVLNASSSVEHQVVGVVFVCQDISECKALEMANALRMEAEAAAHAKTEQLGFRCNAVRQRLSSVEANIAFLEDRGLSNAHRALVGATQQCCTQLMKVMNDVLDLEEQGDARLQVAEVECDLGRIAHDVLSAMHYTAEAKYITTKLDIVGFDHTLVFGDPVRIQQVLSNFAWNAVKFIDRGTIKLVVSAEQEIAGPPKQRVVRFSMQDTGPGISPDVQKMLFKPFFQGDVSTARHYGGSGLGLAICSKLASLMGGKVSCASEEGKGAHFVLELALQVRSDASKSMTMTPHMSWSSTPEKGVLRRSDQDSKKESRSTTEAEAAQARNEQLGFLCHEIRNPLNGVLGNIAFLEDSGLSEEQRALVTSTQQCCTQLMKIMNDVLDLEKLDEGKLQMEVIEFDLEPIVRGVLSQIRNTAESKGVATKLELSGFEHTSVFGDPVRIQQVLSNFAWNAVKFTDEGLIKLDVSVEQEIAGPPKQRLVRFMVQDSGPGISPDVQKKLFKPFVQGDVSTARHYGGSGLGLAICSKLASLMGGQVSCASEEGKGAQFVLELSMEVPDTPSEKAKNVHVKPMDPRWTMGPAENAPLLPSSPIAAAASRKQQQQDEGAATAVHRQAGSRAELEPVDRTVGLLDDKFRDRWHFRVLREVVNPDSVSVLVEVEANGNVRQQWGTAPAGPEAMSEATYAGLAHASRLLGISATSPPPRPRAPDFLGTSSFGVGAAGGGGAGSSDAQLGRSGSSGLLPPTDAASAQPPRGVGNASSSSASGSPLAAAAPASAPPRQPVEEKDCAGGMRLSERQLAMQDPLAAVAERRQKRKEAEQAEKEGGKEGGREEGKEGVKEGVKDKLQRMKSLPEPRKKTPASSDAPKALIVDDEMFNRKIVEVALRKSGFNCASASDGSEAVKLIAKDGSRYDVVLMDQMMKSMNGTEATVLIRQYEMEQGLHPMPIVALTANTAPEDKDSYFRSGMNGVLGKPINVRNLGKSLLSYIETNRASMVQRQAQLHLKTSPGLLVEYRAVEDLVLFAPVPLSSEEQMAYTRAASNITVVLADDRAQLAIDKALTASGIKVLQAQTSEEVLKLVKDRAAPHEQPVDVVLISQTLMGAAKARQLASSIRQYEMGLGLTPVHILCIVDKDEPIEKSLFFTSGMDGIMRHPVNTTTISQSVIAYCEEMEKLREHRFQELANKKSDLVVEYRRLDDILVFDLPSLRVERAASAPDAR